MCLIYWVSGSEHYYELWVQNHLQFNLNLFLILGFLDFPEIIWIRVLVIGF